MIAINLLFFMTEINLLFFMTAINLLRFYDCNLLTALNPVFQYVQTISHVKAQRR